MKVNKNKEIKLKQSSPLEHHQEIEEGKNGFPDPILTQCFKCSHRFWIRWVNTKQRYSVKNDFDYHTEKETDKNLRICNFCLRSLYFDKPIYWKTIQNLKKRAVLAYYVGKKLV